MEQTPINVQWPGWQIVGKLGSGSYGVVYEIQREIFGHTEKAALKILSIPQSNNDIEEMLNDGYDMESLTGRFEEYLQDIVREYSMMAEMKGCANIVYSDDVKYIQHENGIGWDIYIKMELLTALPKAIDRAFSEAQAIKVARDICSALVFCEERNIIHRDIKPQNIFMSADGTYKLGDFGIAKTSDHTTTGTKTGTYKYMAPEVYNNRPYGTRADIYSLGMVLYWMLNERRIPFLPLPPAIPSASEEEAARLKRMSGVAIPEPKNGSEELKRITMKACAYDQEERYHSAQDMLDDLNYLAAAYQTGTKGNTVIPVSDPEREETETIKENGKTVSVEERTSSVHDNASRQSTASPENGNKHRKKLALILIPAVAVLAALGVILPGAFRRDAGTTDAAKDTIAAQSMSLAESEIVMEVGETHRLTAILSPANEADSGAKWLSADPGVAAVSEDGTVTAVKAGKTVIVATSSTGDFTCTCNVTVNSPIAELALNADKLDLGPEDTYQLTVTTDGVEEIRWSSSDPQIAQVSETGLVTAVELGDALITASTEDGQVSAVCSVTVYRKVTGVAFVQATRMLRRGRYYTLVVKITPADATNQNLIWSSSNTKIAVITADGRIKTVGYGGATITVTTEDGGFTAECKIVVQRKKEVWSDNPDDEEEDDDDDMEEVEIENIDD